MVSSKNAARATLLCACLAGCAGDPEAGTEAGVTVDDSMARESLALLAGCFAVTYAFVEDGAHDHLQQAPAEFIDVHERGDEIVARDFFDIGQEVPFHHWTQIWTPLPDGRWRLRVTLANGELRHEGEGAWTLNQWEGAAPGAAKPLRDAERDYATLDRRNVLQLTEPRWIQVEINTKRSEGGEAVASEVGWIEYVRQDEAACEELAQHAASLPPP